jgi:hypothetical protein
MSRRRRRRKTDREAVPPERTLTSKARASIDVGGGGALLSWSLFMMGQVSHGNRKRRG